MNIQKFKAIPMISFLLFNVLFIAELAISMPLYEVTRLETPVGVGSFAHGINELGQVVGSINGIAVLWEDGQINTIPGSDADATDINNSGQIVGSSNSRAVLWESGNIMDLGATGPGWQLASAISETGKVSGWSHYSVTGESYAFTWDSENGYQQLNANGKKAYAYDVNDNGIVVGRIWDDWPHDPVIWQDGNLQKIGNNGQAQGINNLNQVVGAIYDNIAGTSWKAFLWENGNITNLGTIGTANSEAQAINDRSQVVGSLKYQDYEHAMFWQNCRMYDLNDLVTPIPNFILERAFDINNKGQIVGIGTIDGERYAFLLTPITTIDYIIDFILANTNIHGEGPGKSADHRYNAFLNMLLVTADLIDAASYDAACNKLESIFKKCDGLPKPPDFIDGNTDTMGTLVDMLDVLMGSLSCE